jgi:hypothetical protein
MRQGSKSLHGSPARAVWRPSTATSRVATTRATGGARRRGVDGGVAQGAGSMVRGPADRGQPRCAGPAGPRRERRATPARARALERPLCQTVLA